jgi:RNA polymerase sigma-70 factor (ECF subfamily)
VGLEQRVAEALASGAVRAAAEEVIRGYGPEVFGYLARVLRSPEAAAEALSSWAEEVWREIATSSRSSSLRVWAYRVASGAAARVAARAGTRRTPVPTATMASRLADDVRSVTAARLGREAPEMDQLREALTAEERQLLYLRVDRGMEWRELLEVLSGGVEGAPSGEEELRLRFDRLKARLARLAREKGLLR